MAKLSAYLGQGVHFRYFRTNPHFNGIGEIFLVEEQLDKNLLARAVDDVVRRHDSLRARFFMHDGGYFQDVEPEPSKDVFEFMEIERVDDLTELLPRKAEELLNGFDLFTNRILKVVLVRLNVPGQDRLIVLGNHFVCDGYSFHVLWRDICLQYRALEAGRRSAFERPAMKLAEFVSWLEGRRFRPAFDDCLDRWARMNVPGTIWIPRIASCVDVHANSQAIVCRIDKLGTERLKARIQNGYQSWLHHGVLAAFLSVFRARYGRGVLPLAIWTNGHLLYALEDAVPDLIGSCAFPAYVSLQLLTEDFGTLLDLVDSTIAAITDDGAEFGLAMFHEGRPEAWLASVRGIVQPQISFNYFSGLELDRYPIRTGSAPERIARVKYPGNSRFREISIDCNISDGALCIQVEFSRVLHSAEEIRSILDAVENLLKLVANRNIEAVQPHQPDKMQGDQNLADAQDTR